MQKSGLAKNSNTYEHSFWSRRNKNCNVLQKMRKRAQPVSAIQQVMKPLRYNPPWVPAHNHQNDGIR
jgi:hypothetical protein